MSKFDDNIEIKLELNIKILELHKEMKALKKLEEEYPYLSENLKLALRMEKKKLNNLISKHKIKLDEITIKKEPVIRGN